MKTEIEIEIGEKNNNIVCEYIFGNNLIPINWNYEGLNTFPELADEKMYFRGYSRLPDLIKVFFEKDGSTKEYNESYFVPVLRFMSKK